MQCRRFLLIVVAFGIGLRLIVAARGHNFDFDSFLIVTKIVDDGGNVYASTTRYNYGPIWFNLLHIFHFLATIVSPHHELVFRYILVVFLTLVDIGIGFILWRKLNIVIAYAFFLNPISIIITGYHNQFDNLALFFGFLSVIVVGDSFDKPLDKRKLLGLCLLGLSLMTKHVLFAFPFWLAVKQKGLRHKLLIILIPAFIFLLGFIPYWGEGKHGIIQNVFLYRSWDNAFFYNLFVPKSIQLILPSVIAWLSLLAIFAIIFRRKSVVETLLLYTCVLTATSPAITNQYLTIPVAFIAANMNFFSVLYTKIGTFHLLVNEDGLHIRSLQQIIDISPSTFYAILISALFFDLVWVTWREYIIAFFRRAIYEVRVQLGHQE